MAFNQKKTNKTTTTSDMQFSAMLRSIKTDKAIGWFNMTPEFAKAVFGCKPQEISFDQAESQLPGLLDNLKIYVALTDLTIEKQEVVVAVDEY